MGEKERLAELIRSPHRLQGPAGGCGFAATLMGLLSHDINEVNAIWKTCFFGAPYHGISCSMLIRHRTDKRIAAAFLDPKAPNFVDARLCIGLMILLKEYLKERGMADIWESCKTFSNKFPGWLYGDRLKGGFDRSRLERMVQAIPGAPENAVEEVLHYKKGDLALSIEALKWLLSMVGFRTVSGNHLLSNKELEDRSRAIASLTRNPPRAITRSLRNCLDMMKDGTFSGCIIGFAHAQLLDKRMAPHDYIAHWAYLPKPGRLTPDVWKTVVWTHAKESTLKELLQTEFPLIPKYALMIQR